MPEIIAIEKIAQLLKYRDFRSVRKWLAGKNIPLIKLGKSEFADKETFEKTISGLIDAKKNNIHSDYSRRSKYKLQSTTEKKFAQDLHSFLNRANVVSDEN